MNPGSLNTPDLTWLSSQESTSFAGWNDVRLQPDDADVDISELLDQLYDLGQVSPIYFF